MPHPALAHLPPAVFAMAPELATVDLPDEARATCHSCAKGAPRSQVSLDRPFDITLKCCTFHPTHANWLVGRALRRDDAGAERTRARIRLLEGVTLGGIAPTSEWVADYKAGGTIAFGRNPRFRCPYLGDGELSCTVWRDRASVCRTFHCLFVDGERGQALWRSTQLVLSAVERRLAAWCVMHGDPPAEAEWTDPSVLEAWFVECADRVDALTPVESARIRDSVVEKRVDIMLEMDRRHMPPLPPVVGPSVTRFEAQDDGTVRLGASSKLDSILVPGSIFELLSRLDGKTPWPEAVEATNAVVDEPYTGDFIEYLFRLGLLEERDPSVPDPEPGIANVSMLFPVDEELP